MRSVASKVMSGTEVCHALMGKGVAEGGVLEAAAPKAKSWNFRRLNVVLRYSTESHNVALCLSYSLNS